MRIASCSRIPRSFPVSRTVRLLAALLLAVGSAAALGQQTASAPASQPASRPAAGLLQKLTSLAPAQADPARAAKWLVLVYLDADNDLEEDIVEDLREMEIGLRDGVQALVLLDRAKGYDGGRGDWTTTRLYRVRRDANDGALDAELVSELVQDFGELNMADPAILEAFVEGGLRAIPAQQTALILSNHGGGWPHCMVDEDPAGSGKEVDRMSLADVKSAVAGGLRKAGKGKVDLLVFDMCLMGQLEVAQTFADSADYMIAAEDPVVSSGFPYNLALPLFAEAATPREVVEKMVPTYGQQWATSLKSAYTMSGYDLSKVAQVSRDFDALIAALRPMLPQCWPSVSRAVFFGESYVPRNDYRMGQDALATADMVDVLRRMRHSIDGFPVAKLEALEKSLDAFVIAKLIGAGRPLSHGLAFYVPLRKGNLRPEYGRLAMAGQTCYDEFLDELYALHAQKLSKPRVEMPVVLGADGQPAKAAQLLGDQYAQFAVEGNNLLWTTLSLCHRKELNGKVRYVVLFRGFVVDQVYFAKKRQGASQEIDALMPEYKDGRNELQRQIMGIRFALFNGKDARLFPVMLENTNPGNITEGLVPALYEHPSVGDKPIQVRLAFPVSNPVAKTALAEFPKGDGLIELRPIEMKEGAKITPRFELVPSAAGERMIGETFTFHRQLELVPLLMEPGEYAVGVEAESIGGDSDTKMRGFTLEASDDLKALQTRHVPYGSKDLIGEWQLQGQAADPQTGEVDWKDLGVKLAFTAGEENEPVQYVLEKPGDQKLSGAVLINGLKEPLITLYSTMRLPGERDDVAAIVAGGLLGRKVGVFLAYLVGEYDKPVIYSKDLVLGSVWRWEKTSGKMDIVPKDPLGGLWRAGVVSILFANGEYLIQTATQTVDQGTYKLTGKDSLESASASGAKDKMTFVIQGNMLTLTDGRGQSTVFQKAAELKDLLQQQ